MYQTIFRKIFCICKGDNLKIYKEKYQRKIHYNIIIVRKIIILLFKIEIKYYITCNEKY